MSLGVTIIDKVHQKVLNEGGKKYGILIDDSISDIKTKIDIIKQELIANGAKKEGLEIKLKTYQIVFEALLVITNSNAGKFTILGSYIKFENNNLILENTRAIAMGNYYFQDNNGNIIKVEYTFGYQLVNDKLKIDLHHSSLPYSSDS